MTTDNVNLDDIDTRDLEHELLFYVKRSARYHMRREAFYDYWHKFTSASSVILGSTAVGSLLTDILSNKVALYAAAAVAILSAIELVISASTKARLHNDLRRRYLAVEANIIHSNKDIILLREIQHHITQIEADEPPVMRALDAICQNDLCQAMGYEVDEKYYRDLKFYQRWTAHFVNWPVSLQKRRSTAEDE